MSVTIAQTYKLFLVGAIRLIRFTLRRGSTVQTEMSLTTAGIHCNVYDKSASVSGAMEDCSIVRV